jgi:hypothetical protein
MPFEANAGRIVIRDTAGRDVLDTDLDTMHVTGYLQGSTTLGRVALPTGALGPIPSWDADVTLGSASSATVLGGQWRIGNAESLGLGEFRFQSAETPATNWFRRRYLYAPRLQTGEWFPIGGPSMLDMYWFVYSVNPFTVETNSSNLPDVGRLWHTLQFVIDGGSVKLLRRGRNIAREYIYLELGSFPTSQRYAYAFDCAALTIDYRIWLGRFT